MKKTMLFLFSILLLIAIIVFIPFKADAAAISVTGDWTVDYEIHDGSVTDSGGTASVILKVRNTSSSQTITYVSVDIGAGTSSAFYQNDPILDLRPGTSVTLTYHVPIAASDVDKSMNFWVAMSQRDASNVDGIGVTQVVFKGTPYVDFIARLEADKTTVDAGDTVNFTINIVNRGDPLELSYLYDKNDVHLLSGGPFSETYTYRTSMRIDETQDVYYKVYGAMVGAQTTQNTNALRITVREPEPSETPTPSESPTATPSPTSSVEAEGTPTPIVVSPEASVSPDTEGQTTGSIGNILIYILVGLILVMVIVLAIVLGELAKSKNKK